MSVVHVANVHSSLWPAVLCGAIARRTSSTGKRGATRRNTGCKRATKRAHTGGARGGGGHLKGAAVAHHALYCVCPLSARKRLNATLAADNHWHRGPLSRKLLIHLYASPSLHIIFRLQFTPNRLPQFSLSETASGAGALARLRRVSNCGIPCAVRNNTRPCQ